MPLRNLEMKKAKLYIISLFIITCGIILVLPVLKRCCFQNNDTKPVARNNDDSRKDLSAALFEAVNNGDINTVQVLCSRGANVNVTNKYNMSPLHRACTKGYVKIAAILCANGADLEQEDDRGWTALHIACMKGNRSTVELLLAKGAQIDKKDKMGKTPRDWAVQQGHQEIVNLLKK